MKKLKSMSFYIFCILLIVILKIVFSTFSVVGPSMNNTLMEKDEVIVDKLYKSYNRFDIVVIKYNGMKIIKRIIGLPDEKVEYKNNVLYINDKKLTDDYALKETKDFSIKYIGLEKVPTGSYFVLGDNRGESTDSRVLGVISAKNIIGKVVFRILPFSKIGKI